MTKYKVVKKVVSEYEIEVEASSAAEAIRKLVDNEVEGGDLVDDYYLDSANWQVTEIV